MTEAWVASEIDGRQCFLMISTHSQRHILQMRAIKTDAKYPNN